MESDSETQNVALAFGELRASPTRLQRLANIAINQLGLSVLDLDVEPREDGRVALVLPEAWMYLMLSQLAAQAQIIQEKLRKATWQARMKDTRLQAEIQKATKEWEAQQERIYERYKVLTGQGMSHRDVIRQINQESHGELTASVIQTIVEGADPSKRRARKERDARILALEAQGLKIRKIAEQVGVSVVTVKDVLKRKRRRGDAKADRR